MIVLLMIELEDDTVPEKKKDTVFLVVVGRRKQVQIGRMTAFHTRSYFGRHDEMLYSVYI
jgi:hypothetical protein